MDLGALTILRVVEILRSIDSSCGVILSTRSRKATTLSGRLLAYTCFFSLFLPYTYVSYYNAALFRISTIYMGQDTISA